MKYSALITKNSKYNNRPMNSHPALVEHLTWQFPPGPHAITIPGDPLYALCEGVVGDRVHRPGGGGNVCVHVWGGRGRPVEHVRRLEG